MPVAQLTATFVDKLTVVDGEEVLVEIILVLFQQSVCMTVNVTHSPRQQESSSAEYTQSLDNFENDRGSITATRILLPHGFELEFNVRYNFRSASLQDLIFLLVEQRTVGILSESDTQLEILIVNVISLTANVTGTHVVTELDHVSTDDMADDDSVLQDNISWGQLVIVQIPVHFSDHGETTPAA